MVVRAEVGDSPHLGVLVLLVGIPVLQVVSHIVDTVVFKRFAIGVNIWLIVMTAGVTFFLHVAFLLTITAGDVEVPGPVGSGLPIEASLPAGIILG